MKNLFRSKLYGALFLLLLLLIFMTGVLGFKVLSGYSLIDAIYMTIITITTVGYGEVRPLGPLDKIFTSLFIIFSFFTLGYVISVITEYMLSKNNIGNLRKNRVQKKVDSLKDHVIVCGFGRNGKQAAQKLLDYKLKRMKAL